MSWKKQRSVNVPMSPSCHEAYCVLCNEYIEPFTKRRFLWQDSGRIRRIVEHLLQVRITKSDNAELICSSCFSKVRSLSRDVHRIREEINTLVQNIVSHGAAARCRQEVKRKGIGKKITLTVAEAQENQHRWREEIDNMLGHSSSEGSVLLSWPESPTDDGPQQSAPASAQSVTPASLGTVEMLDSSPSSQSISPTLSSATPGPLRTSTPGDLLTSTADLGTSTPGDLGTSTLGELGTSTPGDLGTSKLGDLGTSTPGDLGTSTLGELGTSTPGDLGTPKLGDLGTSTPGDLGTSTAGNLGTSAPGDLGTSTLGELGTSTPGDLGTSKLGDLGTSRPGDLGTSTPEDLGTSTAGHLGTSTSGDLGTSTSGSLETSTRRRSKRLILAGTKKWSLIASGKSSPKVSGRSSSKASARSSPKVSARSSPKASARSSSKASARSSPKASARSSAKASNRPTPVALWRRLSPAGNGGSTVLTEHDYVESTSQSSISGDGSTHDDCKVWDTATGDVQVSAYFDPGHHSYCRTGARDNDVRIFVEIRPGDASKSAHENSTLQDGLTPMGGSYGECTELRGMYVKTERREPARYFASMKKETDGPQQLAPEVQYVYTVKEDDGSERYVDVPPEDPEAEVTFPLPRRRKVKSLWKCPVCALVFASRMLYVQHARREHTGDADARPRHLCGTCGRSFVQLSYLAAHERVHTGERPFACRTCDKTYRLRYALKVHERKHRGEKPYLCAECGKAFACNSSLRQHEKRHITTRTHVCPTCGKAFNNKQPLARHRRIHDGVRPFVCGICGRAFETRYHLVRHGRARHPVEWADVDAARHIIKVNNA